MTFVFNKKISADYVPKGSNCKSNTFLKDIQKFYSKKYKFFIPILFPVIQFFTVLIKLLADSIGVLKTYHHFIFSENRPYYCLVTTFSFQKLYQPIKTNLSRLFSSFPFQIALRSILTTYFYQKGRDDYSLLLAKSVP